MSASSDGPRGLGSKLAELFAIDLRSLALFRIALGAWLLADLIQRWPLLEVNYAETGLLPQSLLAKPEVYSLHALNPSGTWLPLLFGAAALLACMLMLGLYTRLAACLSLPLLLSLHYRNPFLGDGGDLLVRQLLLWSIFLPLGERWSIDARRRATRAPRTAVLSAASVALLLQFVFFFVSTGFAKSGPEWLQERSAIEMALAQTYWSRPLGQRLLEHKELLQWLTPAVLYFERYGPLLMFVPWLTAPLRVLTVLGFGLLMAGLGLTIQLNLFPFAGMLVALPFLPTWLWDGLTGQGGGVVSKYGSRPWDWIGALLVIPLLLHATYLNLLAHGLVRNWPALLEAAVPFGVHQRWTMYGPSPPAFDSRFRVVGSLKGKPPVTLVDTAGEGTWSEMSALHQDYRYKYYIERLLGPDRLGTAPDLRVKVYLEWLCRRWNEAHPETEQLSTLSFYFRPTAIDPNPKVSLPREVRLGYLRCP